MKKRVVITGMGVVSALGIGTDNFWNSIKEGKNGISSVTKIDVSNMNCKVAAEIKEFDSSQFIDKKESRRMYKYSQYAI
jgi:3-oxoacyl-[acyl-carrier-protein] synthase II